MRWRKGLEESQSVALWKDGCEHGSFEVGMLRDCKAVICFGSSVDFDDDDGDEGVEGGDVGDGVGGRGSEGDEIVMVEKKKKRMRMKRS
ncbi:hypothetical protein L195_g031214 [Trifolium pratense]|uniref:Uncharacterized protein n=1 Tax=Trifolium pratense TaxID=57577 RepID=A0A2K3L9R7_TRIPR|nr:hypothetical protein L195_g031214 [Trifolium pratense]